MLLVNCTRGQNKQLVRDFIDDRLNRHDIVAMTNKYLAERTQ
jgi:hypothetical protein